MIKNPPKCELGKCRKFTIEFPEGDIFVWEDHVNKYENKSAEGRLRKNIYIDENNEYKIFGKPLPDTYLAKDATIIKCGDCAYKESLKNDH